MLVALALHLLVAAPLVILDLCTESTIPLRRRMWEDLLWEWYLLLEMVEAID